MNNFVTFDRVADIVKDLTEPKFEVLEKKETEFSYGSITVTIFGESTQMSVIMLFDNNTLIDAMVK